jgi:uncharacterized protein involved in oxidation of intracellular sulfur
VRVLITFDREVRIFLMNDSVDMARDICRPQEGYDQELSRMFAEWVADSEKVLTF